MTYSPSVNAQSGRLSKVYVEDGSLSPATFAVVSGIQDLSFSENNNPVDITNSESNGYQELGGDFGTKVTQISCSGIYNTNSTGFDRIRDALENRTVIRAKIELFTGVIYIGYFFVTEASITGNYNDAVKFTFTLGSTGQVVKIS